jgi:hypothetical protein
MFDASNTGKSDASSEAGLFKQIVMFSASGLAISLAFIFAGDLQILAPWL